MLQFGEVQSTIVSLITEATEFLGLTVIEDLGSQQNATDIETALQQKGIAVSVWPPSVKSLVDGAAGKVVMDTESFIFLEINQDRNELATNPPDPANGNPGGADVNVYTMLKSAVRAVLAYRGNGNPNDLFSLAKEQPITLDASDPGLLRYHVVFEKRCVF